MCRSKPAGTHTEEEKRIQGSPKPTNTNKNLQSHAKGKPTYKATQNTRPANASTAQQKTLKIGNGDETRAFPIFLSNPSSGSSSSTTSSPFETPPPTQTSITARELTVFPAVLRVKSLPVDDHLSSSSVPPPMAMMMNMSVVTRPHRSLLPCRRSIYHCCREVLPRIVV
jgi:hypothetical protein